MQKGKSPSEMNVKPINKMNMKPINKMNMKTSIQSIFMALVAIMSFSLTSCEQDEMIAVALDGNWRGNMYVSYRVGNHDEYCDASYSEVCFLRDPSRYASGRGYWVDYYNDYYRYGWQRNYIANHIEWEVVNGNIKIHFIEDGAYVTIYDYSLDNYHFSGWIELRHGGRQQFSLTHTSSPNYNDYRWGIDRTYIYSNGSSMDMEEDVLNSNQAVVDFENEGTNVSEQSGSPVQLERVFRVRE